jgi:hypothetical protein
VSYGVFVICFTSTFIYAEGADRAANGVKNKGFGLLQQLRSNVAFAVKQNAWEMFATLGLLLNYVARITIKS